MGKQLNESDWLDQGLRELTKHGPGALKAEPLAKSLRISRGSFYWHFKNIGDFHDKLLKRWREQMTERVIDAVNRESRSGLRLTFLMKTALSANLLLERAVRAWATQFAAAEHTVRSVDETRIGFLRSLLEDAGMPEDQVRARAVFIYWAFIGRVVTGDLPALTEADLEALSDLMLSSEGA